VSLFAAGDGNPYDANKIFVIYWPLGHFNLARHRRLLLQCSTTLFEQIIVGSLPAGGALKSITCSLAFVSMHVCE
jgi:hypothetical protein